MNKEYIDREIIKKGRQDENKRIRSDLNRQRIEVEQNRRREMFRIKQELQQLKNRLREMGYTLTDSYGTLAIFDDRDRTPENPEGEVVGSLS